MVDASFQSSHRSRVYYYNFIKIGLSTWVVSGLAFIHFLATLQSSIDTVGYIFTENDVFKMYGIYKDVLYKKE